MAGSNATKSVLGELAKRVPNNQKKQFRHFLDLNTEYKRRVNKYPEKLPRIDWDYYRTNVRIEAIKMVDEFEKKYEELNKVFDDRVKLDTKKYYEELEKQRAVVQAQVKQYIIESNERVKAYEAEIERLCKMKPYSSMTMEEFINLRPECSNYIPHQRKPLFWPHDPDEQTPGPVGLPKADGDRGGGDSGGRGGRQPIKPRDIKDSTESFEFREIEAKPSKDTHQIVALKSEAESEKKPQDKPTEEISSKSVGEPKPYVGKPISEEERQKLDPCGLIKKQAKQEKAEATTPPQEQKPQKVDIEREPRKKSHPCDLVKTKPEPTAKGDDICNTASKGPYKDEAKRTSVFMDPCNVGFGKKADVKPALVKAEPKTEPESQPVESKTSHPCDVVKKKADAKNDTCKSASVKDQSKGGKGTRVFFDPCNAGSGAGVKGDVKAADKETSQCEKVKKKPENEKDSCKSTTKNEHPKDGKDKTRVFEHPCSFGPHSKAADSKEKTTSDTKPCTLEVIKPKDVKKTQPCDDAERPKAGADIIKDKNNFTMMFADPKSDKSSKDRSKEDKNKLDKTCGALPYYNPFRSEEENRDNEEKMCEDSKHDDPCAKDNIEEEYYDPCKDDKYDEDK
ncbi:THO complex subunit 2 [Bactrocera tryoni]|uniref:THO complex subunit 2 n=1 Tax=Bactrocera tryoni TaxID=59916 RepID=UPI001A96268E|nr:THO complex subunit 2 [Bactrocera tryoni]